MQVFHLAKTEWNGVNLFRRHDTNFKIQITRITRIGGNKNTN